MQTNIEQEIKNSGYILYTNVGKSMLPLIRQRKDLLLIKRPPKKCKKYDIVLFKRNNKLILHRIIKVYENSYDIRGDHCIGKELNVYDKDIIGILESLDRNKKTLKMDGRGMKIYGRVICYLFPLRYVYLKMRSVASWIKRSINTH